MSEQLLGQGQDIELLRQAARVSPALFNAVERIESTIQSLTEELEGVPGKVGLRELLAERNKGSFVTEAHHAALAKLQSLTEERDRFKALDEMHSACHEYGLAQELQSTVDMLRAALGDLYETLFHQAPLTPQQRDNARILLSTTKDREGDDG